MENTTRWNKFMQICDKYIKPIFDGFISGMWIVAIVTQMIITAGNVAESAFLLATLWVLINIAGHTLITWVVDPHTMILINNLCSIAFAALPELLFLGVTKTCIGHFLTAFKRRDKVAVTWAILYLIPAISFGIITVYVLSIASKYGLQMAIDLGEQWLIVRYLSGLFYAIIHSIDTAFAKPHFASQMAGKDAEIESLENALKQKQVEMNQAKVRFDNALKTANSNFKTAMEAKQTEFDYRLNEILDQAKVQIEQLQNQLEAKNEQVQKLSERASSLTSQGLENYPKVISELIDRGVKTVSVDDLSALTGISKRRIVNAKSLQRHSRNKDLIMVNSAIEWLKKQPSNGHSEPDTDPLDLPVITIGN